MNFSVIINRLFIGALAFTVFPFYTYAQNDKVERPEYRTKAWEYVKWHLTRYLLHLKH